MSYAALAQMAIGAIQTGISASKASKLGSPKKHTVSKELQEAYNMSRRRADEGYSSAERASFEQMLARQSTTAKRMMQNVGLSGVGSAAANIMGIDALNQFASEGSKIRRANFGQFANMAGQVQGIKTMETQRFNNQLNAERQALGQATQSGIGNMFGAVNSAQNFAQKNKAIDMWGKMGGGGEVGGGFDPSMKTNDGGGSLTPTPSPLMNYENMGFPYSTEAQQQEPNPNWVDPSLLGTPSFGDAGFGQANDWNSLWGQE